MGVDPVSALVGGAGSAVFGKVFGAKPEKPAAVAPVAKPAVEEKSASQIADEEAAKKKAALVAANAGGGQTTTVGGGNADVTRKVLLGL